MEVFRFLLLSLLLQNFHLCFSINDEGRALTRFRERVEIDPYAALSDWLAGKDAAADPCDWFGVECDRGRVVVLNLKNLCLKGTLAPEIGKLTYLKSLILHNNSFYGIIPKEFGELKQLEVLDLGYNNLSGPLPSVLYDILPLHVLVLRSNQFLDGMPFELYELTVLSELDGNTLSSNRRSVTRNVQNATVRRFLQGDNNRRKKRRASLPPPVKPSLPPTSPTGSNPQKDPPMHSPPPPHETPPPTPARFLSKVSPLKNTLIYVGIVVGAFSLFFFFAVCILCSRGSKVVNAKPGTTGLSGQLQKAFVTGVPSLKRMNLEKACEDFSNVIGSLSDCKLYKGTLSTGVEIAVTSTLVTSANDWLKHSDSQFRKKIVTLSKVNHKNFVNLLGYCEEEEPFTRMMVFEYAPNGMLFEHLHIKEAEHLDWAARLRIVMGVAYCLDHMLQLDPPVFLRNLWSTSIYLTDDFAAKISDFEFWSQTTMAETSAGSSVSLDKQSLRMEGIVYEYGILVLEIISGRLPYSRDGGQLLDWASDYLGGSKPLKDMVDPTLRSFREDDVIAVCEVIRHCCHPEPLARPPMKAVAARLGEITLVTPEGATPRLSPLWWAELEIASAETNSSQN